MRRKAPSRRSRSHARKRKIRRSSTHRSRPRLRGASRPLMSRKPFVPDTLKPSVSVIVCGCSNHTVHTVRQLQKLAAADVILVLSGEQAARFHELRALPQLTLVVLPELLGPHEVRSVGASLASGEILLFVDGTTALDERAVYALIAAIEQGAALALTDQMPQLGRFDRWSDVDRVRAFINWSLGSSFLAANSVELLPHAWSREGAAAIGLPCLAAPAAAQEAAIRAGLRILVVPGGSTRGSARLAHEQLESHAIGDQVEALVMAMRQLGGRLQFADRNRKRKQGAGGDAR